MSLMNYGFTKSKLEKVGAEESNNTNSKDEIEIITVIESPKKNCSMSSSKLDSESKKTCQRSPKSSSKSSSKPNFPSKIPKSSPSKKTSPQGSPKGKALKNNMDSSPNSINKSEKSLKANWIDSSKCPNKSEESSPVSKKSPTDASLPYQRIKIIMKSCPDVEIVPNEVLHIMTKATEMFVEYLALESVQSVDSPILDYESLSNLVHCKDNLEFLKETIPKKVTWAECQKLIAKRKADDMDNV